MKTLKQYISEGRPSQRHPLEGHEYHKKTDAELKYIAKDAHEAAESMKGHNTSAENKYRDQVNDSATVRHWRKEHGMPDWYKKKYEHMKEEVEQIDELNAKEYDKKKKGVVEGMSVNNRLSDLWKNHGNAFNQLDYYTNNSIDRKKIQKYKKIIDQLESRCKAEFGSKVCAAMKKHTDAMADSWYGHSNRSGEILAAKLRKQFDVDWDGQLNEAEQGVAEEAEHIDEVAAWQRKEGKSESGGLNRKGIESYRRENPGSKLSMAVTTKPSKLKPGSKAANRRKSFCARMGGMKKRLTSAKTANDPDSRINKALRKWNC